MAESFSETLAISTRRARGHFLWLAEKKQLKRRVADKSCHGRLLLVYPLLVPVQHQAGCGMIKPSEMVFQPFKLIDRKIIGRIVGYLDPPSAVCLALTCKRLKASVSNTCGTSKLKEICPRDVRSNITTSLRPYNIFTGMLQSGAYNIDNLKLCPEVPEPDDVIPLAIVREVAWAKDCSAELASQGSIPSTGSDRNSRRSLFDRYRGQDLIISVEWHILVACIVRWMGGEYKYCDKHGGWIKWDQTSQVPCRRCARTLGPQTIPGEFESQDQDD